jgi:hypothetical protein
MTKPLFVATVTIETERRWRRRYRINVGRLYNDDACRT